MRKTEKEAAKRVLVGMAPATRLALSFGDCSSWQEAVLFCADQGWLEGTPQSGFRMTADGLSMRDSLTRRFWARKGIWAAALALVTLCIAAAGVVVDAVK